MHEYKTIETAVQDILLKEKGSKFIGYAYPVANETEVRTCLEVIKAQHPKATHHCYAFRFGVNGKIYRANDDGEPSGSAGLPIYNQLIANEVTNVLLVVVRYFGGTKLGTAGLVKAYKECAKLTLDAATIIIREPQFSFQIEFPYLQQNTVFALLNKHRIPFSNFTANSLCSLTIQIKSSQKEGILEILSGMPYLTLKEI